MELPMQVAGFQPVGSRGLGSLQAAVTDVKPAPSFTTPSNGGERGFNSVPHTVTAEPVVFPRDGLPADQRPVHLRQQKAAARYKEFQDLGTGRKPRRDPDSRSN
jgi:hypothetical protein